MYVYINVCFFREREREFRNNILLFLGVMVFLFRKLVRKKIIRIKTEFSSRIR